MKKEKDLRKKLLEAIEMYERLNQQEDTFYGTQYNKGFISGVRYSLILLIKESGSENTGLLNRLKKLVSKKEVVLVEKKDINLSEAEKEVADLLEKGLTNKEIAELLSKKPNTVRNQVQSILTKTNNPNRSQFVYSRMKKVSNEQ